MAQQLVQQTVSSLYLLRWRTASKIDGAIYVTASIQSVREGRLHPMKDIAIRTGRVDFFPIPRKMALYH